MRPTREGRVTPQRAGLIYKGIGVDPGTETEDPDPPTDRAPDGEAFVPFLPPPDPGPVQDLNLIYGTDSDGGGNRPVVDPTNANDGDSSTLAYRTSFFNGGGTKTWYLEADLGTAYDVDEIVIRGGFGNSGENDPPWEIAHSPDGSTWTTAVGSYVWDGATTPRTATLTLTSTETKRYWRIGQTITYSGLIFPVKVHSFEINGAAVGDPSNPIWIDAPLTIDGDGTTYDLASEDTLTSTAGAFWRGDLGDSYLIASLLAEVGFEDAGSVTVLVQAGDESDYSDQATVATVTLTATGSYTSDDVSAPSISTGVHRYWQLVLSTAAQGVYVYEVGLFDPPEFTGTHEDLTGREDADQHPADAVSYDNTVSGLTADDVQAAIDEIAAGSTSGPDVSLVEVAAAGSTETVDVDAARTYDLTLTADLTLSLTGAVNDEAWYVTVAFRQDGTGGWDVTHPGSVVWLGGSPPDIDPDPNAVTWVTYASFDGGTVWYGFPVGGGGATVTPSATVADETSFGISPAAGASDEYSRGDHTHGTPAAPTTAGEDTDVVIVGATGTTETLDCTLARTYDITLSDNCVISLTGATALEAHYMTVIIRQDSVGSRVATWPSSVEWPGNVTPTLTTTAYYADMVSFRTTNGGSTWFGEIVGQNYQQVAPATGAFFPMLALSQG